MRDKILKLVEKYGLIMLSGGLTALGAYLSTANPVLAGLLGVLITKAVDAIDKKIDTFKVVRFALGRREN